MHKVIEDYVTEFINRWHVNEQRAWVDHLQQAHGKKWKLEWEKKYGSTATAS